MPTKKSKETMTVTLPVAASPGRVAEIARFFQLALDAADVDLGESSVTMVVNNFALHAEFRPQNRRGEKAVRMVGEVIANPVVAARKHPSYRSVAEAIAKHGITIAHLKAEIQMAGKKTSLDDTSIGAIRGVATPPAEKTHRISGTTATHSRVLRAGRDRETSEFSARIEIHGQYRDVPIEKEVTSRFLDALKTNDLYRIGLALEWIVDESGRTEVDPKSIRATSIEGFQPISGEELISMIQIDEQTARAFIKNHELDS